MMSDDAREGTICPGKKPSIFCQHSNLGSFCVKAMLQQLLTSAGDGDSTSDDGQHHHRHLLGSNHCSHPPHHSSQYLHSHSHQDTRCEEVGEILNFRVGEGQQDHGAWAGSIEYLIQQRAVPHQPS